LTADERSRLLEAVEEEAGKGFRVIALAYKPGSPGDLSAPEDQVEAGLTLLGFASLIDPPRPEVPQAVREALEAGVKVVMVTGDHPATAKAVAEMMKYRSYSTDMMPINAKNRKKYATSIARDVSRSFSETELISKPAYFAIADSFSLLPFQ